MAFIEPILELQHCNAATSTITTLKNSHVENDTQHMTSLEIAELTGKQHKDVMKAIRNMEPAWVNIAGSNFRLGSYKDLNGLKFQLVEYRDLKGEPVGGVVREPVARVVAAADLVPSPRFFSSSMAASVIELLLGLLRIALSVAPRSVVSS